MRKTFIYTGVFLLIGLSGYAQIHIQSGASLFIEPGASVTVEGNASLMDGSTLINNGIVTAGNTSGLPANWVDQTVSSYHYGNGRFIFNATGNQSLSSSNTFEYIEMNGFGLTLGSNIGAHKWHLTNGIIHTGSFRATATSTEQSAMEPDATNVDFVNSWINGTVRRFISPAIVNNYIFPIGNADRSSPAEMDNLTTEPLNVSFIDAFFTPKTGTDAGLVVTEQGSTYISINEGGIWHLAPDGEPSAGKYNLKLYFNGFTDLADNRFAILRRPEGSAQAADWSVPVGSSVNPNGGEGRMVADRYALRNNLSGFSEFGIGLVSTPLPIKLTVFNAKRETSMQVLLTWETETEQNNRGFEIERRLDFETEFTPRGFVNSRALNGNSSDVLHYAYPDENDYSNITYYRLRQLDIDGRASYSAIKAVKGVYSVDVSIFPNPSKGQFSILLKGARSQKEAFIMDISGKIVRKLFIPGNRQLNVSNLNAGTYVLIIPNAFGEGADFREKIIVVE